MMDSTYASAFYVLSSLYDVKIDFATVEPELDNSGNVVAEEKANKHRVTMSLPLAKDLADKLADVVKNYEERFGAIPAPDGEDEE